MANEIRQYSLTVPAGTAIASPVSADMSFPPREVQALEIIIPPGCNGVVGLQVQNSHLAVIPFGSDAWLVGNDEVISWPLDGYINSGSWQAAGYNLGANDHTIRFRFLLNLVGVTTGPGVATLIDTAAISSSGTDTEDFTLATDTSSDDSVDLTGLA